jgi:GDP-mannose 6-dehydrogenase
MKISIFGLGYVGCVSLGCLAQNGFEVIGVDVSKGKVDLIRQGLPTIIEKDIDRIIREQHTLGRIDATHDYRRAVLESEVSIICVGTPSTAEGSLNLEYIYETARQIGETLKEKQAFHIVVIRSTVIPGTNEKVGKIVAESSGKERNSGFAIVSNPEFLREGSAVEDYYNPPFTLVGTDNKMAGKTMRDIYARVNGEFVISEINATELIKYVNNSYHALKVTFANEVGNICKKLGIDSHEVMRLFCLDKQLNISNYYFKPGFAYGGSCLPKDLKALKTLALHNGLSSPVLESIEPSNQYHIHVAAQMVRDLGKKKIGILGVAFKDGTDDLRYSPIINVIEDLMEAGCEVKVFDQHVNDALLIGANKDYMESNLPFLGKMLCDRDKDLVEWAEVVVVNRKSAEYIEWVAQYRDKSFVDLVRLGVSSYPENYTGLCW